MTRVLLAARPLNGITSDRISDLPRDLLFQPRIHEIQHGENPDDFNDNRRFDGRNPGYVSGISRFARLLFPQGCTHYYAIVASLRTQVSTF